MLLHITSLPGGRLGAPAFAFVDWLAEAGQTWWQVLPLGPPDRYGSPYKSSSAFAAWNGLLGRPRARVSAAQRSEFRERNAYWIDGWERFGGSVDDQVRFEREWRELRDYARERGVRLIGDIAIYVAPRSVDHREHRDLFLDGVVAGAPPDDFSATGQLWGNPLYDWAALRRDGYRWWIARLERALSKFELVRIDHFRGFVAFWAVPRGASDARRGAWRRGPGIRLFRALSGALPGPLPLVAEDLGVITPAVERLRDLLGLPGMLVLQFGFDPRRPASAHRPGNHVEDRIVYTGTHDHDTARGWLESIDSATRRRVEVELRTHGVEQPEPWWGLIALAHASPSRVAMIQAQDLLGLGSEARMNHPARRSGNWRWRLRDGALTPELAQRLREITERFCRLS